MRQLLSLLSLVLRLFSDALVTYEPLVGFGKCCNCGDFVCIRADCAYVGRRDVEFEEGHEARTCTLELELDQVVDSVRHGDGGRVVMVIATRWTRLIQYATRDAKI
jgi:hypothetical protein